MGTAATALATAPLAGRVMTAESGHAWQTAVATDCATMAHATVSTAGVVLIAHSVSSVRTIAPVTGAARTFLVLAMRDGWVMTAH